MIHISDHALVRFLERSEAVDIAALRQLLSRSLERSRRLAERVGTVDFELTVDGLRYVVRGCELVTVIKAGAKGPRR